MTSLNVYSEEKVLMVTGEWAPYTSSNMANKGVVSEIVKFALKQSDIELNLEFKFWPQCYASVLQGYAAASFPFFKTEKREEKMLYSNPIMSSKVLFFYRKNRVEVTSFKNLTELQKYKVSGVNGFFYRDSFRAAELNMVYSDSETEALKKVHSGFAELIPMDEVTGWELIKKNYPEQIEEFATMSTPIREDNLYLIVSRANPKAQQIIEKFNNGLNKIKRNGTYSKILAKLK